MTVSCLVELKCADTEWVSEDIEQQQCITGWDSQYNSVGKSGQMSWNGQTALREREIWQTQPVHYGRGQGLNTMGEYRSSVQWASTGVQYSILELRFLKSSFLIALAWRSIPRASFSNWTMSMLSDMTPVLCRKQLTRQSQYWLITSCLCSSGFKEWFMSQVRIKIGIYKYWIFPANINLKTRT